MKDTGRRVPPLRAATAAALLAVTAAGCGADPDPSIFADRKKVRIGAKSDQPGTSLERHAGDFDGLDIAVARELLDRVGAEPPIFSGILSKNRAPALREGEVDLVVATFSVTAKRMLPVGEGGDGLDFVGPYASTQQGMLVRAADLERYRTLDDLNGRLVCVWKGTTSADELRKPAYQAIRLREEEDAGYCVNALKAGEVDAVSTDQLILYGFMEAEPTLAVAPAIAFAETNDYGVAMAKGHREDCERLRDALKKYVVSNEWDRDVENNLPRLPLERRNEARPTEAEIDGVSCRDRPVGAPVG
ncbi:transporter substrate-binding domain-containing protein [Kitasatospora sp. NPDC057500]|uniref:transporter substrate-binding domain-containing protein n=1 Tax=Kitasatospora sp. NPDC057500 TaxID=3346151 RepID=UPI0036A9240C